MLDPTTWGWHTGVVEQAFQPTISVEGEANEIGDLALDGDIDLAEYRVFAARCRDCFTRVHTSNGTTVAPSSTKRSTVRLPIPLLPPVMIATDSAAGIQPADDQGWPGTDSQLPKIGSPAVIPPSTARVWPVMLDARLEQRNATASAISSGV